MKIRKVTIAVLAMFLIGGTVVFADTVSQKLRVFVNKDELNDGGVLVDGKAYLGVRALADSMQAMIVWDDSEKKVVITKPNVHMFVMKDNVLFGGVEKGKTKFKVHSQIDNLKVDISAFKVTLTDPYNDTTVLDERDSSDKSDFPAGKEAFWCATDEKTFNFKYSGKYVVRFWMKAKGGESMQVVSEKMITVN